MVTPSPPPNSTSDDALPSEPILPSVVLTGYHFNVAPFACIAIHTTGGCHDGQQASSSTTHCVEFYFGIWILWNRNPSGIILPQKNPSLSMPLQMYHLIVLLNWWMPNCINAVAAAILLAFAYFIRNPPPALPKTPSKGNLPIQQSNPITTYPIRQHIWMRYNAA